VVRLFGRRKGRRRGTVRAASPTDIAHLTEFVKTAGAEGAREFARKHGVPLYDAGVVGYPQRMRDWNAKRKAGGDLRRPPGTSP